MSLGEPNATRIGGVAGMLIFLSMFTKKDINFRKAKTSKSRREAGRAGAAARWGKGTEAISQSA